MMKKLSPTILSFLLVMVYLAAPTTSQAQVDAVRIVVSFSRADRISITRFYFSQAKRTLEVGTKVLIEKGVYKSLYNQFEAGALDLNDDQLKGWPRYNGMPWLRNDLFRYEFAFQWRMVKYLEDKGLANDRLLKLQKERLFAEHEAFESTIFKVFRPNADEQFFNNIKSMRLALVRLRQKVR